MKIIGISDIQIRNNTRQEEYKSVFDKTIFEIKKLDPDRIVIAGDVFHHKSTLSPESVSLAPYFFKKLTDICDVDVIAGNHDVGKDYNRIDAVQALIENNMKNWNLKYSLNYYRESGVYKIDDELEYFVWDFRDKDHKKYIKTKNISIGLYHGAPYAIKLNSGETLNPEIDNSVFSNCDYALFGDIHKREFWHNRTQCMIGSLICQNHDEEDYPHGFVMLDTDTGEFTEYEIPNDWGYFTIRDEHIKVIDENSVKVIATIPFKYFNLRTRLRNEYTDNQILSIKKEIKKKYKKDISISVYVDSVKFNKEYNPMNLNDVSVQNSLMQEYCKDNKIGNVDDILKINEEVNKNIKDFSDIMYGVVWEPVELQFKNVFSFGDKLNIIDFTKLNGITSISGKNGTGKSSALSIILFILFGKTPKISNQSEIINDRQNDAWMQLIINVNGDKYRITKELIKKRKNVSASLSFEKFDEKLNEYVTDDSDKTDTNTDIKQNITKILGNYDDILMSSFSLQNDFQKMIEAKETERKNYFYNFIGLNIFQHLYKASGPLQSKYQSIVDKYKSTDFEEKIQDVETEIKNSNINIKQYNNMILEYSDKLDKLDEKINDVTSKRAILEDKMKDTPKINVIKNEMDTKYGDITFAKNMIDKNKETLLSKELRLNEWKKTDIEKELNSLISIIDEQKEIETTIFDSISSLDQDYLKLEEKRKINDELNNKISNIMNKLSSLDVTIKNFKRQSEIIDKQPWMIDNEKCNICVLSKDAMEAKQKLSENIELQKKANMVKDKLKSQIIIGIDDRMSAISNTKKENSDALKNIRNEIKILNEKKDNLSKIENRIKELELDIEKINNNIFLYSEKMKTSKKEYDDLSKQYDAIKSFLTISGEIESYNSQLKDLTVDKLEYKKYISALNEKINKEHSNIGNNTALIESIKKEYSDYDDALKQLMIVTEYRNIVNKNGLPFSTLQKFIPSFNKKISEYLSNDMVNFELKLDVEDDKLRILTRKYSDSWRDIKSAGGMETVYSSWIIRAVLSEFSILPKSDLLVLDEGFGAADVDSLGNLELLFSKLKQKFNKIMVISHIPLITDFCDNEIEILVDDDGFSYLK